MVDWMISSPIRIALLQAEQREAGGSPFTVRESMEYEADGSPLEAPGPIVEKEFGQPLSVEDGLARAEVRRPETSTYRGYTDPAP